MSKSIYLPTLSHWEYQNPWSGNVGDVRYFIQVSKDPLTMNVQLWHGQMSLPFAEDIVTAQFPVTEEGLSEMHQWLDGHCFN